MMIWLPLLSAAILIAGSYSTIHFHEEFNDADYHQKWVQSKHAGKEFGKFEWTAGKFYGDEHKDKGLKTSEDARFYGISAKFQDNKFSNEGKPLVIQFSGKSSSIQYIIKKSN